MAFVGNALVFRHTFKELWNDRLSGRLGKLAKCNRMLVINLAASDFLMGVYLLTIGTVSLITDGRYGYSISWAAGVGKEALASTGWKYSKLGVHRFLTDVT